MGRKKQCSFCDNRAERTVSDENDFFPCCLDCEAAWARDPGFQRAAKTPATPIEGADQ